jgi:hypothetical protein
VERGYDTDDAARRLEAVLRARTSSDLEPAR